MLQASIIGNLGADAREENYNGNKFLSFSVAHKDTYTDQQGQQHETTTWVSCTLNGDGGRLRQYLVKGKCVFVQGRLSTRVYSSPRDRRMVAGINIAADRIELIGGRVDEVPARLISSDGEVVEIKKAFFIDPKKAKELGATKDKPIVLRGSDGSEFSCTLQGLVSPIKREETQPNAEENVEVY